MSLEISKFLPKREIKTLKGCKASSQSTTGALSSSKSRFKKKKDLEQQSSENSSNGAYDQFDRNLRDIEIELK